MTSTAEQQQRAQEPTYAGASAAQIHGRLLVMERFTRSARSAVDAKDVERARDAARLAAVELAEILDALEQAMPAEQLTWQALEERRVGRPWQPDRDEHPGPPLVDTTWTDPVVVSAADLMATTYAWPGADRPAPPGALRAFCQLARQQPHVVPDMPTVVGAAFPQIRRALVRDGCLPDSMR